MTDKDWNLFFDLLEKIVSQPGAWQEKKEAIQAEAATRDSAGALEEFAGWFVE
jgi:hypothetical protein